MNRPSHPGRSSRRGRPSRKLSRHARLAARGEVRHLGAFRPASLRRKWRLVCAQMYVPGTPAYNNHLKKYGPPSEFGYKEVLRDWNPVKLDPEKLTEIYKDAGARFLMIQGVHHDNFDLWNLHYQPWNSVNLGPKRDLLGEWTKACRAEGIRFGVTFHHEYTGGGGRRRSAATSKAQRPVCLTTAI